MAAKSKEAAEQENVEHDTKQVEQIRAILKRYTRFSAHRPVNIAEFPAGQRACSG
jgi:hypothetical protein